MEMGESDGKRESAVTFDARSYLGVWPLVCSVCGETFGVINAYAHLGAVVRGEAFYFCSQCRALPEGEVLAQLDALDAAMTEVAA